MTRCIIDLLFARCSPYGRMLFVELYVNVLLLLLLFVFVVVLGGCYLS